MVVGLHGRFLQDISSLGSYLTVNGLFRIAVPVFLIINGFYFYTVLKKKSQVTWLKRVTILYVVWMTFYSFFFYSLPDFSLIGLAKLLKHLILGYLHLWYIAGMIGAALLVIVLSKLSSILLLVSVILTFLLGVTIQYLAHYYVVEDRLHALLNETWFHRNMFLFSYPFFCIGYLIRKHKLHENLSIKSAALLSFFGLLVLSFESFLNFCKFGIDGSFDNLLSLILVCPFIFIFFLKYPVVGSSKNLTLYSTAIYFIHPLFLKGFIQFTQFDKTILTIATIMASVAASYFLIQLNSKLKILL